MSDAIGVYSELEVIVGQHIYEQECGPAGGEWRGVNLNCRPVWYQKARNIMKIITDYDNAMTWAETGRAEH